MGRSGSQNTLTAYLSPWYPTQVCLRHPQQRLLGCHMACLPPVPKRVSHLLTQLFSAEGQNSNLGEEGVGVGRQDTDMYTHSIAPWCSNLGVLVSSAQL